jgi:hypothetical protein
MAIVGSIKGGDGTKGTAIWATPRGLDTVSSEIFTGIKKVASRKPKAMQASIWVAMVNPFQGSNLQISKHLWP